MYSRVIKRAGLELLTLLRSGKWSETKRILAKAAIRILYIIALLPLGFFFTLIIRIMRPWFLIRIQKLNSQRMGHFAGNTEIYLCERDAGINTPKMPYVDLWFHSWPICNRQLAWMWGRVLHIWPAWLLDPTSRMNSFIPGGRVHQIGENTMNDRDIFNLLDRFPPHLCFLAEEEKHGQAGLRMLGIPENAPFVCLNVRDNAYLRNSIPWNPWSYHDYRNCSIQNYVCAAQELANRGYYVVRMGATVNEAMNAAHPMIIDYAANGTRSEFMDIYLGAKCAFCISNGTGFDAVPYIFRRPIVYVDHVPVGIINTFSSKFLATTKKHWLRGENRFMTLREIIESGAAYFFWADDYESKGIDLIESTPEEITAVVLEMESRLKGTWCATEEDAVLQDRFWKMLLDSAINSSSKAMIIMTANGTKPFHGEIRSRFGADFLRGNKAWLN